MGIVRHKTKYAIRSRRNVLPKVTQGGFKNRSKDNRFLLQILQIQKLHKNKI